MRIIRTPRFWNAHTHSRYSNGDALSHIDQLVDRAVELNQPALGLTDHGNMAGSVELYKACMKAGIKPFPGSELYFVPDIWRTRLTAGTGTSRRPAGTTSGCWRTPPRATRTWSTCPR